MERCILVITATLGTRDTLRRTVESVKKIGGKYVNHVIVAPNVVIPKLQREYPDLVFIAEPEGKKGIYPAINHGFNTYGHNYKYQTFINDDDYWLPDFKFLIKETQKNKDIDFVYGKVNFILENKNKQVKEMACSKQFKDFIPLLHRNIVLFTQQATLIKSELFFSLGGFSEEYKLVSDTLFWGKLSLLNISFKYIPKACAAYTIQEGQLSSDNSLQSNEMKAIIYSELPIPHTIKIFKSFLKYRISNFFIYIKRIIQH